MESDFCVPPDLCWKRGFSGVDSASFTSTVIWGDPPPSAGDIPIPRTLLNYLNRVSSISGKFSGIDLNSCEEGPWAVNYWHEQQKILTLITSSLREPVYVDGAQEDAKQNPITSANNDIKLPSATPGIQVPISSLSKTAVKSIATSNVAVPLRAELHQNAVPQLNSNQSPKDVPNGQHANEEKDKPTIISQQAGKSASAQDPKPRPSYEPPAHTRQAEKPMPVPINSPGFGAFFKNDPLKPAEIEWLDNEKVALADNSLELASNKIAGPKGSDREVLVPPEKPVFGVESTKNDFGSVASQISGVQGDNDKELNVDDENVVFEHKSTNDDLDVPNENIVDPHPQKDSNMESMVVLDDPPVLAPLIMVDGSRVPLPTPSPPSFNLPVYKVRIGSSTFEVSKQSKSALIIGSQTLLPGDIVTIQNVPISVPPFIPTLVIGSNTMTLSPLATSTPDPRSRTITLDSTSFVVSQISPSEIVIDSQTLTPGGVITAKNRLISLLSANKAFIVGDRTLTLPSVPTPAPALPTINEAIIGSSTVRVQRLPSSALLIGSQTLVLGSRITVQNRPISLLPGNDEILVGDTTAKLQPVTAAAAAAAAASPTDSPLTGQVIIDSIAYKYTMLSPSSIQIGSQVLKPGGVITINGHHVSFMLSPSSAPATPVPSSPMGNNNNNKFFSPNPKVADSDALKITQTITTPTPTPTFSSTNTTTTEEEGGNIANIPKPEPNSNNGAGSTGNGNRLSSSLSSITVTMMMMMMMMSLGVLV